MEKRDKPSYESQGVLGQLYRRAHEAEKESVKNFIRLDYEKSILQNYELDPVQVEKARENPSVFRHLEGVYKRIVRPMEEDLKRLVIKVGICSEAEIFCSNLQFKVYQQFTVDDYQEKPTRKGNKSEEKKKLVQSLNILIENYTLVFETIFSEQLALLQPQLNSAGSMEKALN